MEPASEVRSDERQAPPASRRRRQRRFLAAFLAVVGVAAIVAGLMADPGTDPAAGRSGSAGSSSDGGAGGVTGPLEGDRPPSTGPGGVGTQPEKTGLPAEPPEGGQVRTGSEEEGCFDTMAEYLEDWHRTGKEPDPCFKTQPPSNQEQPEGVRRTYNGQRF